ncbi:MAG TPA: DUF2207 domain-containing protein, partial [Anaerolineales bacterium]|nr:DUF2207 domain-containing protein [Anaerolineae bacterium]HIQ00539.1 DUF2207 domain-containing protein [Anaerolineales bacterium]
MEGRGFFRPPGVSLWCPVWHKSPIRFEGGALVMTTRRLQRLIPLTLLLFLFPLLSALPAHAQTKTLYWERMDVDITILPDGSFLVEETQVIVFTSGTFTYGYRSIPTDRLTAVTDVAVWEDGQPCRWTTDEEDGEFQIRWDLLEPRQDSRHTYTLRYLVHGGLRYYDGGDQLWWKAVFPDRSFPVNGSTVTVHLPEGATAELAQAYFTEATVSGIGTSTVVFTAQESIDPGQEFEVRVQFPHGVVAGSPAAWQRVEDSKPIVNLLMGLLGGLLLVGGPAMLLLLWYVRGRDPYVEIPTDYLTEPPSDAPPAVAGTLVDEKADMQDVLATIIDLARRGYLEIEESPIRGLFVSSYDCIFRRTDKPDDDLLPYEKYLLRRLVGRRSGRRMSSLRNRFYTAIPKIQERLYNEVVRRGYFRTRPDRVRKAYTGTGTAILFVVFPASFCLMSALSQYTSTAICPMIGLGATAVTLIVIGRFMPTKTRKGAEEAARWRAFKRYLEQIEQYTDLQEATDQFEKYLPYAIAFGLDRTWTRKFSRIETTPVPAWYIPVPVPVGGRYSTSGGRGSGLSSPSPPPSLDGMSRGLGTSLDAMSRGLGKMLDAAGSTLASRPSSSG